MTAPGDTPDRWALLGAGLVGGLFGPFMLFIWHQLWSVGRELRTLAANTGTTGTDVGAAPGPFAGTPLGIWALLALGMGLLALAVVGPAVALHRDARFVAETGAWTPHSGAWPLGAALFPLSVVIVGAYLWRRHRRVGRHPPGHPVVGPLRASRLPVVAATLPVLSGAMAVALAWQGVQSGDVLGLTAGVVTGAGLVAMSLLVFQITLWLDLEWLRAAGVAPSPDPWNRRAVRLVVLFLPAPVVGVLWIRRRRRWLRD